MDIRKLKKFTAVFSGVCACGAFVALAGGVQWGTGFCAFIAAATFVIAGLIAGAAVVS